jgi:hypothetical protein
MGKLNAKGQGVNVEGLDRLRKDLKAVSADAPKELRQAHVSIAGTVAEDARDRAYGLGGVAAKTAPTIRASGTQAGAAIALGGPTAPWSAGAEFGGQGRPTTQQFRPHLGRTGYFVYPSIRDNAEDAERRELEAIDGLMRKHNLL